VISPIVPISNARPFQVHSPELENGFPPAVAFNVITVGDGDVLARKMMRVIRLPIIASPDSKTR
jgi:hypothetical protein